MKLQFSGSPEIAAPREEVWRRLNDPEFVAASAPGVQSVEVTDPDHFKVVAAFGVAAIKLKFALDVERFDVVDGQSAKMRARGKAPGSAVEMLAAANLADAGPGRTRLDWTADSDVSGTVASVGARLLEGTARKLTEQFWKDFARRVETAA
jgi:carbon monoxide dehydrogenase subunit G